MDTLSTLTGTFLSLVSIAVLLLVVRAIHALYFSPLCHIPGPAICKVSDLPLRYLNARLARNQRIFEWHQKYGPVIVIAPGEVSFSSGPVAREIYSAAARHPKSSYFDNLAMYGFRSVFMAREAHEHRRLRKRVFGYYQPTSVYKPATLRYVRALAGNAREQMAVEVGEAGEGYASINVFTHCNAYSFDNITRFCLGPKLCSDAIRGGDKARENYVGWEECELWAPLGASFPSALTLVKLYKQHIARDALFLTGDKRLQEWTTAQLAVAAADPSKSGEESLLRQMLGVEKEDGSRLPIEEIAEEILDNFFAAQSVVTNALVFLLWDLACHPEWQRKVREQLQALPKDRDDGLPSWTDIETASFLDACLQESSRVHPLASGRAERVVSATKAYGEAIIPAGTIVSASTKALHYDPKAFPSPQAFDPDRWIDADDARLQAMRSSFMPYGQGARICLGIPFAMAQMKHFVACLLLEFEFLEDAGSGTDAASMSQLGTQSALPRGLRCDLLVRRIEREAS